MSLLRVDIFWISLGIKLGIKFGFFGVRVKEKEGNWILLVNNFDDFLLWVNSKKIILWL